VYTQCLIVSPEILARFANNPFSVLRAALASGALETHQQVPARLETLNLMGRSPAVDATLLARLAANPGADWMATLIEAALTSKNLGLVGGPPTEQLIAGLLNCLPPECRTEFSFSTGLVYSSQRPFRIVRLPKDPAERRRVQNQYHLEVLELSSGTPTEYAPLDGWARLIRRVLHSGRTSFLATQFAKRRFELAPADLPALGLQLLEEWDESSLPVEAADERADQPPRPPAVTDGLSGMQRAHAAHQRFEGNTVAASAVVPETEAPPEPIDPDSPEVLEKLELMDDLVFGAIGGKRSALEQLRTVWPELRDTLGEELLAESREQYLRRALLIWGNSHEPDGVRSPENAIRAMDVLCVLFDGV
jgi:hypothetical protein